MGFQCVPNYLFVFAEVRVKVGREPKSKGHQLISHVSSKTLFIQITSIRLLNDCISKSNPYQIKKKKSNQIHI